jgi:hypothetical protein
MGNNNSVYDTTSHLTKYHTAPDSLLSQLYGKECETKRHHMNFYKEHAKKLMHELQDTDSMAQMDIFVTARGYDLPYMSRHPSQADSGAPTKSDDLWNVSDSMKYVEIEVCHDGEPGAIQRYAINPFTPDHTCGANCECIEDTVSVHNGNVTHWKPMTGGANKKKDKMKNNNKALDYETTESPSENTSPLESTVSPKPDEKKKLKKIKESSDDVDFDESDTTDEELAEIEKEEEDIQSEDGIILDNSSISSSDLYRMQSRLFGSLTPSDKYDDEDIGDNVYSEEVQRAINDINREKQMFSSEDNEILNMDTPAELINRKQKMNAKYHLHGLH